MMRMKTLGTAAAAIAVLAAGAAWWGLGREAPPEWRTAPLSRGPVEITVTATGALQAVTTVQVGTQVSGTISDLYADFNSRVTKGQVIARLDTTLLAAALNDSRSSLERAEAQHAQASAEHTRMRRLFERDLVSRAELEQADAAARVTNANLSSARAQVERALINLRYAIIRSPIDGIVLSRAVELGQTVAASFNTPTLFTLAGDMSEMRVEAAVDEADIGRLRAGQSATFTVDAYPDTVFSGTVEQVRLQPTVTQNVVTYAVILRASNPDLRLMPGMTATLTIVTERRDDVLRAPVAALRFTPPAPEGGGGPTGTTGREAQSMRGDRLYVLDGNLPRAVSVRTGLSDGIFTEILADDGANLAPGVPVLTGLVSSAAASGGGAPFGMQRRGGGRR